MPLLILASKTMSNYTIDLAHISHLPLLADIERAAAAFFPDRVINPSLRAGVVPSGILENAQIDKRLWVVLDADNTPVGFAIVIPEGDSAFLHEIDVHPNHQRQGLGRQLIQKVIDWAKSQGFATVSLTTFETVPWNAPYYERLGFGKLTRSELNPSLEKKLAFEREIGLKERVAMEYRLVN